MVSFRGLLEDPEAAEDKKDRAHGHELVHDIFGGAGSHILRVDGSFGESLHRSAAFLCRRQKVVPVDERGDCATLGRKGALLTRLDANEIERMPNFQMNFQ